MLKGLEHLSWEGRQAASWGCSGWRGEGSGEALESLMGWEWATAAGEGPLQGHGVMGQGEIALS